LSLPTIARATDREKPVIRDARAAKMTPAFDAEQHGFLRAENIRPALDAELYFCAMLVLRSNLRF
jgi:hypothetical protein